LACRCAAVSREGRFDEASPAGPASQPPQDGADQVASEGTTQGHRMLGRTPRVLFASPVQPIGGCSANVFCWDKPPGWARVVISLLDPPALLSRRATLRCDALPSPAGGQFAAALAAPRDVLGLSFYVNETEIALGRAEQARRSGVREVWAGNFGAYSPQVEA